MHMRRIVLWIVPLLVFGPGLWADDKPKDKDKEDKKPAAGEKTAAEQYQALMKEMQKAQQDIVQNYRQAKTDEEREKIIEKYQKLPQEFVGRFMELAQKNPKEKAALDALAFVVSNAPAGAAGDKAVDLLLKDYGDKLDARFCQALANASSPAAEKVLRGILAKGGEPNADAKVQAQACLSLAQNLKKRSESPNLKFTEAQKLNKEAEAMFVQVTEKYADEAKLADQAKKELGDVRQGVGREMPEIEGEDVDGKKFKLSDYRGKVVLLDFWGHW
jgi:hypothetical protein